MRYILIDVSGKVLNYDYALCQELVKIANVAIAAHKLGGEHYSGSRIPLLRIIPLKYKNSTSIFKRLVKAIECLLNYFWLLIVFFIKKPDVIHFQWLPFMEFCGIDVFYISLIRFLFPSLRIVLTIHNVYPHDIGEKEKIEYRVRFYRLRKNISHYIVHTENTKQEIINQFEIDNKSISVIAHGIFCPDLTSKKSCYPKSGKIIMYGNNLPYKGADILLDSIHLLPKEEKETVFIEIVGATKSDYYEKLKSEAIGLNVHFIPTFIPDKELYQLIQQSDYIALPYRRISQSGVLLLALSFRKPLLVADLPSFKETLQGFTDDMFFEANNAESLSQLILRHLRKEINLNKQFSAIDHLNELYSWKNSAEATVKLYSSLL